MNTSELRSTVIDALRAIAPEADPAIDDAAPIRETLDLDSMDFLNFVIAIHESLHVEIPQTDYPKVQTLGALLSYLEHKLAPAPS